MSKSWPDIRAHAGRFAREYQNERRERAEAQSFWNDFFDVFGVSRRRVASFDVPALKADGGGGFIDLFWRKVVIVEHKSAGRDLDRAHRQATDYFVGIRTEDLPRYVLVSDFRRFRLHDLETGSQEEFALAQLPEKVSLFAFILGQQTRPVQSEQPVNMEAALLMGRLHDSFKRDNYVGHELEVFLVRLMFCLFADDSGIFQPKDQFQFLMEQTRLDGSDVGTRIGEVFQVLDQPEARRSQHLDADLSALQHVNGRLFQETIRLPVFTAETRSVLLEACRYDWTKVSPAIFGAMFQAVMDDDEEADLRRRLGAHYTSELNIAKVIDTLFLNALRAKHEDAKNHPDRLTALLTEIRGMRFFDPACGCGNFLIIAYREVRRLETKIHARLIAINRGQRQEVLDAAIGGIDVNALYGVEIEEFPARVAEVAIYLMDHLMNKELSEVLGEYRPRLPLRNAPNIKAGNALDLDWDKFCPRHETVRIGRRQNETPLRVFILGNPPFIGKKRREDSQNVDMERICGAIDGNGKLDYVACWYVKAADYIANTQIPCALVSTNSIVQGEQVSILFNHLLSRGISIRFAHRTFEWANEATNNASVHCVIIGFAYGQPQRGTKLPIHDYETVDALTSVVIEATHINPYLLDYPDDTVVISRTKPIADVPEIRFGSMPNDGGFLLFNDREKRQFVQDDPRAEPFMRPMLSSDELIKGRLRWCLWLHDVDPTLWRGIPSIMARVEQVRAKRAASDRATTRELADVPYRFGEVRQPAGPYLIIPRHSLERRRYVPMVMAKPNEIASDSCTFIEGANLYHYGVLMSDMHMAWVRHVCGRIKSDFRYSNRIVYNNFPWPDADVASQAAIAAAAGTIKDVLDRRIQAGATLEALYDPNTMPEDLISGHRAVSRVVDRAYAFRRDTVNDRNRMIFLLDRYARAAAPIVPEALGAASATPTRRRGGPPGSGDRKTVAE